jgi:hypothetical protein
MHDRGFFYQQRGSATADGWRSLDRMTQFLTIGSSILTGGGAPL